jgi:hypothetical protein
MLILDAVNVHLLSDEISHMNLEWSLNKIIGATRAIEGSAYWIALVVNWMQTLGSQPVMPKISPITGTRCLPKP